MEGNSAGDVQGARNRTGAGGGSPDHPRPRRPSRRAKAPADEVPADVTVAHAAQERASAPPRRQRPAGRV
jgi:hypothetical protein